MFTDGTDNLPYLFRSNVKLAQHRAAHTFVLAQNAHQQMLGAYLRRF